MPIFILTCDEGYCQGVYTTRKIAEEAKKRLGLTCGDISEEEMDQMPPLLNEKYYWELGITRDLKVSHVEYHSMPSWKEEQIRVTPTGWGIWYVYCYAKDEEEAKRVSLQGVAAAISAGLVLPEVEPVDRYSQALEVTKSMIFTDDSEEFLKAAKKLGVDRAKRQG